MSIVRGYNTYPNVVRIDRASLMRALHKKEKARLVIHGESTGWATVLLDARHFLAQKLAAGIRTGIAATAWSVLACLVLWWLPVRPKGVDLAYLIPLVAGIALFRAAGVIQAARLQKRLRKVIGDLLRVAPATQPKMAPPAHLWVKTKMPRLRRIQPLLASVALLLWTVTLEQVAMPIPGYWAVITSSGGERQAAHAITRLGPGDRWQLAPTHISGYVYGVVSYDEPAQRLLVVRFDYSMDNPTGMLVPAEVKEKMNAYASNMAHSIGTNLDAAAPVGMDRLDWSYSALQGDDQIAQLLEGAVRTAASTQFKSSTSVRAQFEVISLAKYRAYAKK